MAIPFDQLPEMRNAHVLMMKELLQEAKDKEKSENFQNWHSRKKLCVSWIHLQSCRGGILFPKPRNKKSYKIFVNQKA